MAAKDAALPSIAQAAQKPWLYVRDKCEPEKKPKKADKKITGVDGDWLTEGTEAYKVAKKVFDTFTQEFGTSGAFAAGALANVKGESGFVPDRGETYWNAPYGIYTFGMDGEEPDPNMGPSTKTQEENYGREYFGGGLFQFTKWTKMIEGPWWRRLNPNQGWAPENQVDAVLGLEFWNRAIVGYMHRARAWDDSGSLLYTAEEFISTNDPEQAALYFMMAYERPETPHLERLEWAKQANEVFNKDDIQADKSKWRFDTNGDVTVNKKEKKKKKCSVDGRSGKNGGDVTHANWGNDGTGEFPSGAPHAFGPDNVPEELKPYILDPKAVGMSYGSSGGWTNPGDQCAHFASSFLYALWEKDGERNPAAAGASGEWYGGKFAHTYAGKYGGEVSRTPSKGAIGSTLPPSTMTTHPAGHVWIVCHVFENGDTLIVEQNFSGYGVASGYAAHENCTWNFRLVTKGELERNDAYYFTPSDVGYSPASSIASGD